MKRFHFTSLQTKLLLGGVCDIQNSPVCNLNENGVISDI